MPDRVKGLTEIQGNNYNIRVNSEQVAVTITRSKLNNRRCKQNEAFDKEDFRDWSNYLMFSSVCQRSKNSKSRLYVRLRYNTCQKQPAKAHISKHIHLTSTDIATVLYRGLPPSLTQLYCVVCHWNCIVHIGTDVSSLRSLFAAGKRVRGLMPLCM